MKAKTEDVQWPETLFVDEWPRDPGLHHGQVLAWLQDKMNPVKSSNTGAGFKDMKLTAEIGLLWEMVLSKVMAEKYAIRPKPMEVDGIWLSPDGINEDPAGKVPMVIDEYKATWKSTKWPPTGEFKYMTQLKSYCRAYGTNVGVMHIFYLMGDYKGSGPIYRVCRIEFTKQELEENWKLILRCRDQMFNKKGK